MINARLFQRYGIDTKKNLKLTEHCARPFDTILIDKLGSCYACECTAWLPQSIGNLQIAPLEKIIQSPMRKHLQSSINDGTYRYCNEHQCTYIKKPPGRRKLEILQLQVFSLYLQQKTQSFLD